MKPWPPLALAGLVLLGNCDDMSRQPKQTAYSPQAAPLTPPAGIVAFAARPHPAPRLTAALMARGQQRYRIFCTPCHSELGDGRGMVVRRGFPAPPSFLQARLREAPSTHFYDVITHGFGAMYPFAARIAPADRWAIVAYIRALQRSGHADIASLAPADRPAPP